MRIRKRSERDFELDLAVALPPGITILFGPSGAGKTTTLDCIAGLVQPDEGRIANPPRISSSTARLESTFLLSFAESAMFFRIWPFVRIEMRRCAGPLRYVRGTMARHARTEPEFLWTTAVHAVDALRHIAGEVADASLRAMQPNGSSATWFGVDLRFENGCLGRIDVLPTAGVLEETYELFGEGYRATVTCPFGAQRGWRAFQENRLVIDESAPSDMPEDVLNGCYDEASALIEALARGQRPWPSIEAVFPSVELGLSMARTVEETTTNTFPIENKTRG